VAGKTEITSTENKPVAVEAPPPLWLSLLEFPEFKGLTGDVLKRLATVLTARGPPVANRFGRIPVAVQRSGLCRRSLYDLAKKHKGLFRKAGAAVIVDLEFLDEILAGLPAAKYPSPTRKSRGRKEKGRRGRDAA